MAGKIVFVSDTSGESFYKEDYTEFEYYSISCSRKQTDSQSGCVDYLYMGDHIDGICAIR